MINTDIKRFRQICNLYEKLLRSEEDILLILQDELISYDTARAEALIAIDKALQNNSLHTVVMKRALNLQEKARATEAQIVRQTARVQEVRKQVKLANTIYEKQKESHGKALEAAAMVDILEKYTKVRTSFS